MIAEKREVAAVPVTVGFPWSECQVIETGDKSLYKILMVREFSGTVWDEDTHGRVYSHRLSY